MENLVLDGDAEHSILLDGNFEENWWDCLYLQPVLHHGIRKKHTLEITISDQDTEGNSPFYLLSLILA